MFARFITIQEKQTLARAVGIQKKKRKKERKKEIGVATHFSEII